jgi:hypothetical protein
MEKNRSNDGSALQKFDDSCEELKSADTIIEMYGDRSIVRYRTIVDE